MGSPRTPDLHTKEKKASHKVRGTAKTLYGLYEHVDGEQTSSDTVLCYGLLLNM